MDLRLETIAHDLAFPPGGIEQCALWEEAFIKADRDLGVSLDPASLRIAGGEASLSAAMCDAVVSFASKVATDPSLLVFFRYCRHRVLHDASMVLSWEEPWPSLDSHLGDEAGLFNVLVMLSAMPEQREAHRKLGIPEAISRDTLADLRLWMETDRYSLSGRWGITPWIARWLCKHWQGKLVRLGRLQFSQSAFAGRILVLRNRMTGELRAISEGNVRYREDGGAWGECCGETTRTWMSRLEERAGILIGNPVDGTGRAIPSPVSLSMDEWELKLARNDPMLTFHIPAGEPLDPSACVASFRKALDFFPAVLGNNRFKGFWTGSWLLEPLFKELLGADSNIVLFQRSLRPWPGIQGGNGQFIERAFGWGKTSLEGLERMTSLQKAIGRHLDAGGHFHGGYAFLLREDV